MYIVISHRIIPGVISHLLKINIYYGDIKFFLLHVHRVYINITIVHVWSCLI